jgi:protein phosphatase
MTNIFRKIFGGEDGGGNAAGRTDVGRKRKANEDDFSILADRNIFIVADGMGGHNAGEVASSETVKALDAHFSSERVAMLKKEPEKIPEEFECAFKEINRLIHQMGVENPKYSRMGCALIMAFVHDGVLHTCHVGDVRCYVCNASGISQLTHDHTEVAMLVRAGTMTPEEAERSPLKNILTEAIGSPAPITPECNSYILAQGDRVLLCTDGLWGMVDDEEILRIVTKKRKIGEICGDLIARANTAGGKDNITAVVFES